MLVLRAPRPRSAAHRHYNDAFLGVERNLHGHAVLLTLTTVPGYKNLYEHTDYDSVGNAAPRVGWPTT
jgi:hypothetical protein